jgi:RNA polymerase sigma-70 factor (ECF subfamily)
MMSTPPTATRNAATDLDGAYQQMRDRLRAFIARRVENPETAEDLTQEVLLRLVHNSRSNELNDPTAWLYRVARNVIIDHYRGRRPSQTPGAGHPLATDPVTDPFADDPSSARRELALCVRSLIEQLAEPYRSAVRAVDLDGATHAAVAASTGLSIPGVKSRVQRGRRRLRDLLLTCCTLDISVNGAVVDYTAPPSCAVNPGCAGVAPAARR